MQVSHVSAGRRDDNGAHKSKSVGGRRWQTCDYAVDPVVVRQIVDHFGVREPKVDAFASVDNRRFPVFWSEADSAWSRSWTWRRQGLLWMNPPYDVIDDVVEKICADRAKVILVVPEW